MLFVPSFCLWTTKQFLFPNLEESIASFIYIELGGRMEVYFSLLLFLLPLTSASCFGRDAHFKKSKAPVIVQPNRADPTKVSLFLVADFWYYLVDHLDHLCSQILVSWDQAIERPQCVDRCGAHCPLPPSPPSSTPTSSSLDTGCVSGRKAQKCHTEVDILSTRPTKPKSRYWVGCIRFGLQILLGRQSVRVDLCWKPLNKVFSSSANKGWPKTPVLQFLTLIKTAELVMA